jgi:Bacterial SH3 domain
MQKRFFKITAILTLTVASITGINAQTSSFRLRTADSLFRAKQFTQSLEHYQAILKNNEYTPAMLLKMAFIQEGLGHPGKTLYYLNLYYKASGDVGALRKMEELATTYQLGGYTTTDADRFLSWYLDERDYISIALIALCVFLLALAFRRRFRQHKRPVAAFIFMTLTLVTLAIHLNYGDDLSLGVIADPNTYIMEGPSPGSDVIESVEEGHRIEVLGKKDVWLKVRWHGEVAYVKANHVLNVSL